MSQFLNQKILYIYRGNEEMNLLKIGLNLLRDSKLLAKSKGKELFSFATRHQSRTTVAQGFNESSLLLCHMTDYAPVNGVIRSARDSVFAKTGVNSIRDSVHFSLNHPVKGHICGNWDNKKYCVMIPFDSALKVNDKGKFVAGYTADIFTSGSVRLPKGSVIVRYNKRLKPGRYIVRDASKIKQFKDTHGILLIDSAVPPAQISDNVIRKLGYDVFDESFSAGIVGKTKKNCVTNMKKFNTMAQRNGIIPMTHSASPNAIIEMLFAAFAAGGKYENKAEVLEIIKGINKISKQSKIPLEIDIDMFYKLVEKSKTPKQALELIKNEMNLKPTLVANYKKFIPDRETAKRIQQQYIFLSKEIISQYDKNLNAIQKPTIKKLFG